MSKQRAEFFGSGQLGVLQTAVGECLSTAKTLRRVSISEHVTQPLPAVSAFSVSTHIDRRLLDLHKRSLAVRLLQRSLPITL